jgi:hypothetical protein
MDLFASSKDHLTLLPDEGLIKVLVSQEGPGEVGMSRVDYLQSAQGIEVKSKHDHIRRAEMFRFYGRPETLKASHLISS